MRRDSFPRIVTIILISLCATSYAASTQEQSACPQMPAVKDGFAYSQISGIQETENPSSANLCSKADEFKGDCYTVWAENSDYLKPQCQTLPEPTTILYLCMGSVAILRKRRK
jgi:hypothetical protein